jgi:NAD(P)H-nitrite reductase large subunit
MMKTHVIIGCGPAGASAAERIRELEPGSDVVVITDEPHGFYVREHLNRLLEGSETEEQLFEKGKDFLERIGVRLVHDRVVGVSASPRAVVCTGETLACDTLLVASGGKPRNLGVPGETFEGVTPLYTLDDARTLVGLLRDSRSVTIAGCGTTAVKILPGLLAHGKRVSVVERAPLALANLLDEAGSSIVESELARRGVALHPGSGILRFDGKGGKLSIAVLHDGTALPADAAIVAVGVAPSVDFLAGCGVRVERGVVVDTGMRTNVAGVFAAGDVAQAPDPLWGGSPRLHSSWSLAVEQGRLAAEAVAGRPADSPGAISSIGIQVFDLGIASAGVVRERPGDGVFARSEPDRRLYRKCVTRDGALIGCLIVDPVLPRKQVKKWLAKRLIGGGGLGVDVGAVLEGGPEFFS